MTHYEVHPDDLRHVARRGDECFDELDRLRGGLTALRLPSTSFPMNAGQSLVSAYHEWLDRYADTVGGEVVQGREQMSGLRFAARAYEGCDGAAASGYQTLAA